MRVEDGVQVYQDTLWKRTENLRDAFDPAVSSPAGRRDTSNDDVTEEGKKTPLLCHFVQKRSFYQDQDRLGTNIGKTQKKEIRVFLEDIEFEVLEEEEEDLPPAAAATAVGFAGAASAVVVRTPKDRF
eukprot:COSAG06_NODE_895_length_11669_cov_5.131384_15_plen_128_part_00